MRNSDGVLSETTPSPVPYRRPFVYGGKDRPTQARPILKPHWRRALFWLIPALIAVLAAGGAGWLAERLAIAQLLEQAGPRRDIYVEGLRSELGRYETLPSVMTYSTTLRQMLSAPGNEPLSQRASTYLEQVATVSGAAAIYAIDTEGTTRAASNWQGPASFVGMNFSYRPYFRDAMAKGYGRFYGIGTTSGEAGYYFARSIPGPDGVLGVVVVKVTLTGMERTWGQAADRVLVKDGHGVTILSSVPGWTFRTLEPLSDGLRERLAATRQYDRVELQGLAVQQLADLGAGASVLRIGGPGAKPLLATARNVPGTDWQLLLLTDMAPVANAQRIAWAAGAAAVLLLTLVAMLVRQRRRTRAAERATRAALERSAQALEREVAARTAELVAANDDLRRAQDGLVQAAKLAALGQLAAGITHELNQPLAALRTLSDNAAAFLARGKVDRVTENLTMIGQLTERMARITGQLRGFARKSENRPEPVRLAVAAGNSLALLTEKSRRLDANVETAIDPDLWVRFDPIRLEQVLVNLLGNALDAVAGGPVREVRLEAVREGPRALVRVLDSGSGIAPESLPHLFEPFFTTKPPGQGLGLGLVISAGMVQDHGGSIHAANRPEGGAMFTIDLPAHG
ncbi:two-component system, NtrC family, C4-dicarboxylate transport sensor histidine kinase DctB [Azospirillum sp. RU38E]|nr:two-component system, NtrC family, C4-dicarboxylate transport sensor histidine kinase DctB [Azospirillum sp. RU38E]SNS89103.1 two-component system, NtrC family, C4-dicarboxylate transport sensor histidine kinase DctB [Azospirillum sp. RU37A]